jgi:HK97 family phage major capsid protein
MSDTLQLEDVAKAVHDLTEAVTEMKAGQVDRATVEALEARVVEAQEAAKEAQNAAREGITPADVLEEAASAYRGAKTPEERMAFLHGEFDVADGIQLKPRDIARIANVKDEDLREFHRAADDVVLLANALGVDPRETKYYEREFKPLMAAMDTATAAEGTEWKPTELSAALIQRVELSLEVAGLFPGIEMPTQPYEIPGMAVARIRSGKHAEQTADTGQTGFKKVTPGSRKVTLSAVKFAAEALVSKEAEEDLIIPILPLMQDELVYGLSADVDDCIINGDTTGPHMDSDVTASDDPRKNWKGLRKLAAAGAKIDGASVAKLTVSHLRANRKVMGKYGIAPAQLAHIVSMAAYIELLDDTSVLTLEKYGPNATVLTGELARVDGVPIIVSAYVRQDLNAAGVYDGVTTTETEAITAYRNGFLRGRRRGVTVQVLREVYAEYDQDAILASQRLAFEPRFPVATENIVALTYNIDS